MTLLAGLVVGLYVLTVTAFAAKETMVVDLTFVLDNTTLFWPGSPPFTFTVLSREQKATGYWYESNAFSTAEHGGTHVDAPSHFYRGGWRAEQIPPSHLVGPAVVVDVKVQAAADPDYQLSVSDVKAWEAMQGRKIPRNAIVLMNSGWARRYPNATRVFNTDLPDDPTTFHFPGVHPEAALFLATKRDVIAVGVDTPSTDHGQSKTFETHVTLARHNVLGLENVANLGALPARGATVVIGLAKLGDGSGGPARILGLVGRLPKGGACSRNQRGKRRNDRARGKQRYDKNRP